jgi:colanic acid/amylovoran biosynthesis protein
LLVNLHSSCNAGDDALTQEALRQLGEQFPGAAFTLAMNDPGSYDGQGQAVGSFIYWVKPIVAGEASARTQSPARWRWRAFPGFMLQSLLALASYRLAGRPWAPFLSAERRALLDAYFGADMVVSTAGNFLYSSSGIGLPFLLSLFSIYYACLAGKPVYTLPQTLGPIHRKREEWLAKRVLARARLVLIRDPISAEVWKDWGVRGPEWELLPDLAFAGSGYVVGAERQQAIDLLAEYGLCDEGHRPWLGVTLIRWGAQNRSFDRQSPYERAVEAAIRAFVASHGGRVAIFAQVQGPTAAEDDLIPARRVVSRLGDLGDAVVLIDRRVPPRVLKAAYGQMDLFLGTRLHSNIFALTEGVPVVAIGYQYKTRGIMRMLDLENWVMDIGNVDGEALADLLRRAWVYRERIREHLGGVLPHMRARASEAGGIIAADLRSIAGGSRAGS